jgi:hypothetical protein
MPYFWYELYLKQQKPTKMDFFNIQSANFLGGQNVHNLIKLSLVGFIAYKLYKK